jgi:hypothetical protein
MTEELSLDQLKSRWNEVLDLLMDRDRTLWLAFFDARLASYQNGVLTLDYVDATKFSGEHDFKKLRTPTQIQLLQQAIAQVFGVSPTIQEV